MEFAVNNTLDKIQKASMINCNEEKKCAMCGQIIFLKEIHIICQVKEIGGQYKMKNYCCNCFDKKIDDDVKRIRKWSNKTIEDLRNMKNPMEEYMGSDAKKEVDNMRKMLNKIEGEEDE